MHYVRMRNGKNKNVSEKRFNLRRVSHLPVEQREKERERERNEHKHTKTKRNVTETEEEKNRISRQNFSVRETGKSLGFH